MVLQLGAWAWQVGGIIVSPTRELAKQIHDVAQPFVSSVPGLTSALYVGGRCGTVSGSYISTLSTILSDCMHAHEHTHAQSCMCAQASAYLARCCA